MERRLDWLGVATFRLKLGNLVIFLDAYMERVPRAAPVGLRASEVTKAHYILVGHSHWDHLWGASQIAQQTGATIIGSYETRRIAIEEGVPAEQTIAVAGGERLRLDKDIDLLVYPSLHSSVWSSGLAVASDKVFTGDLCVHEGEKRERAASVRAGWASSQEPGADEARKHLALFAPGYWSDGGPLAFLLLTPGGTIFWKDTSGHWTGVLRDIGRLDIALLAAAARGNVDGEPMQGSLADFLAREASILRPARVILNHHDDWLPPITEQLDIGPVRQAFVRQSPDSQLVEVGYMDGYEIT